MSFFASTYETLMEEIVKKYGDEGKKLIYDAYHKSIKDSGETGKPVKLPYYKMMPPYTR